mmetsp:Transcript_39804/g.83179  ORF Transcript_39804/g.83179 Transcript_39804/m.83179 type:complete len:806 (-) Transcript_39804:89-2506(-)
MKNKNVRNDDCFVAASLAIVDGTHLCLLPSLDATGNKNDDSKKRKNRSSSSLRNGGSSSSSSGDNSNTQPDDSIYTTVPALPLSSVRIICGDEYQREGAATLTGNNDTENSILELPPIETIRLRTSDLSNAEYRLIRSVSLVNGSSVLPTRIVLSDDAVEGTVALSDDMQHVEVCLPSFACDFASNGNDDDECSLYGKEHYNILGYIDCMSNDNDGTDNHDPSKFEVHGAGSCLVADFLGIAGYEQTLVSPRLNKNLLSTISNADQENEDYIQQCKQLLQMLLRNSFVTDGSGILHSKRLEQFVTKTKTDNTTIISIPPLELPSKMTGGERKSLELKQNVVKVHSLTPERGESILPGQTAGKCITTESYDRNDANSSGKSSCETPQANPGWLEDIAQTVEHRLKKEVEKSEQLERSTQVRSELVYQGRKTLHAASRCNFNASTKMFSNSLEWSDPEIVRLRYGTRPRTSMETSRGISVMLDFEVDVILRNRFESDEPNPNEKNLSSSNVLHDFHLSCSLASNNQSPLHSSSASPPTSIRTVCGVVPTLQHGDCITILASLLFKDMETILQDSSDASTLDINIQGLWTDASSKIPSDEWSPAKTEVRHGAVLSILRLPVDALFLTPPLTSIPRSGHWIQNEIDFTSDNNDSGSHPIPSAIFDHRQPRTLIVDASREMNSTQDATMWKEMVSNLNASIGGNSFIDLYCKKGDPRLKLVIFGSNPDERAATVKLVLRSLPESVKLIIEDPDEKQNVRALLISLKNEANALKRHISLPSKEICPELLGEIAALQIYTDGVASTIKRGWA